MFTLIKKSRLKKIAAAASACVMLAVSAAGGFMDTLHISAATGEYKTWKQSDPRWAGTYIGKSGETMSQSGCAITSLAALVVQAGYLDESSFNPGIFCNFLSSKGGVDGSGNIYWGAVTQLVPDFSFAGTQYLYGSSEEAKASEIKSYLNQGYYVISDVKYCGHWVAIDSVVDNTVYSIDPASYTTNILFDQYDYRGATRLKLFRKSGTQTTPSKPAQDQDSGKKYSTGHYVTTAKLNFRDNPSTSANILSVLDINKRVEVTEISKNWGKVTYDGKTGWICLDYTAVIDSSDEETVVYKTGTYKTKDVINYRQKADISSQSFGLIQKNTPLAITEIQGQWGKTVYNGKTCWVCLEYADFISSEIVTQPEATQTTAQTTTPVTTQSQPPVSVTTPAPVTTAAVTTIATTTTAAPVTTMVTETSREPETQQTQKPETALTTTTVQTTSETTQTQKTQAPATTEATSLQTTPPAVTTTPVSESPKPEDESFDPSDVMPGDLNGDKKVNSLDMVMLINMLFGHHDPISPQLMEAADCDNDSSITVRDLISLKFIIISG
ncbi:MAG: SH3 domain-containing protein [Oscillospiraceae bacterium]|nr:SH3 domain-containing protein [Oscillospiraceae bacterium]